MYLASGHVTKVVPFIGGESALTPDRIFVWGFPLLKEIANAIPHVQNRLTVALTSL